MWVVINRSLNLAESLLLDSGGLMLQALSEKHNSFLRPLKKKGFKEERVTTIGLYDIGKSHDPGIQQEPYSVFGAGNYPQGRGTHSNSNFGSQDVSSLGLSLKASLASSLSPFIMKSIR